MKEEEEADKTIAGYAKRTRGSYSFGKVLCDSLKHKVQCSKITLNNLHKTGSTEEVFKSHSHGGPGCVFILLSLNVRGQQ